jgi:hypothetical protein
MVASILDQNFRETQINAGSNTLVTRGTGGQSVSIINKMGGGGTAATPQPFDVSLSSDSTNTSQYTATIQAGTVNNILPSNMWNSFSTYGDSRYIWKLRCSTDGTSVSSVQIIVDSSQALPQVPVKFMLPFTFDIVFAVSFKAQVWRIIGDGSPFAYSSPLYTTDKDWYDLGAFPYETYYCWRW